MTRDGWPLPGATVTVLGASGVQAGRATSAADGSFALTGLAPGPATLLVAAPGHEPSARSLVVPAAHDWDLGTVVLTRSGSQDLPPAGRWVIDPMHTSLQATAHHLGLSSVTGRLTRLEGVITVAEPFAESTVEVTIDASSIDTGVAQRDEHLRSADFLDVARHPQITYRGAGLTPTATSAWALEGELTLLGTARPVRLEMECTGTGDDPWGGVRAAFHATAQLRRDDFAMNWNQAVGLGVAVFGTTLRVTIDLEAVQQDTAAAG
jgi:polyisoprenoid-binding protein YceI